MYQSKPANLNSNITHGSSQDLEAAINEIKQQILKEGDKDDSTATERFKILEELAKFNFGKFLIINKGINGYWTRYMVLHPQDGRLSGKNDENKAHGAFETWLLDRAPVLLATQERFFNFQRLLQGQLKEGVSLASIPCGLMDDLLGLNYYGLNDFSLTGIDIDEDSLKYAKQNAEQNRLEKHCRLNQADAWNLNVKNEYDVITSNGLNFYEPDNDRVIELYSELYKALKPNGCFISSFLTPPPAKGIKSPWDAKQINAEDLRIQKVLFAYILNVRWQAAYRTEEETQAQLTKAGFKDIRFIYDRQRMFPTFVAIK